MHSGAAWCWSFHVGNRRLVLLVRMRKGDCVAPVALSAPVAQDVEYRKVDFQ